jgi:predicted phosphodiesterase
MEQQKKCLAIGDIHGRPFWRNHLDEDFDEFFILGDYFDSYRYTYVQERENFLRIVQAARADTRLKLCLGNHDYHYLSDDPFERYSRYRADHAREIRELLEGAMDLMKIVYVRGSTLICHAGLSATFMEEHELAAPEDVNAAFARDKTILAFNGFDPFGADVTQGPLWIRPGSLLTDAVPGYAQIVGHTPMKDITRCQADNGESVTFIDTGETENVLRFSVGDTISY